MHNDKYRQQTFCGQDSLDIQNHKKYKLFTKMQRIIEKDFINGFSFHKRRSNKDDSLILRSLSLTARKIKQQIVQTNQKYF